MTEQEWDRCTDPEAMLEFLRGRASDRKLRLFACACCRKVWSLLPDEQGRRAVEAAEQFADGAVSQETLRQALRGITATLRPSLPREEWIKANASLAAWYAAGPSAEQGAGKAVLHAGLAARRALSLTAEAEEAVHVATLRDVFGNPFRPALVDPAWVAWHGGAVGKLAQAAYEERELPAGHLDAVRLAVLADMLEEAGCSDADLLGHLRSDGPHVRGCFAVDQLLARE